MAQDVSETRHHTRFHTVYFPPGPWGGDNDRSRHVLSGKGTGALISRAGRQGRPRRPSQLGSGGQEVHGGVQALVRQPAFLEDAALLCVHGVEPVFLRVPDDVLRNSHGLNAQKQQCGEEGF